MANRPKKYGGMSRGTDREREEQGRKRGPRRGRDEIQESDWNQAPRRGRQGRASESDTWERDESLGRRDQQVQPDQDEIEPEDIDSNR